MNEFMLMTCDLYRTRPDKTFYHPRYRGVPFIFFHSYNDNNNFDEFIVIWLEGERSSTTDIVSAKERLCHSDKISFNDLTTNELLRASHEFLSYAKSR